MSTDFKALIRARSRELSLVGTWDAEGTIAVREPARHYQPHLWRWTDLRPLLLQAAQNFTLKDAIRRVLVLSNPSVYPKHYTTNTLYVSCSVYNPGERAPVHRHTTNASRFVLEGAGGYTNIEGEKCSMSRGDLIITPNGYWHDHGNEGSEPVMWVDVLDIPLVDSLGATRFEFDYYEGEPGRPRKEDFQSVRYAQDHSVAVYGTGGIRPTFVSHRRGANDLASPMFIYRGEATLEALERLRGYEGDPYNGIMLEFVNPLSGGHLTATMSFNVQMLRGGERTRRHRHTGSVAYCCLQGRGKTLVDGVELEWGENDLFVVPSWSWRQHVNLDPRGDAILYAVNDLPALKTLGLYFAEDGQ